MPTSWISFGPDLEPLESESRGGSQRPAARRDGVRVSGTSDDVVFKLVQASGTTGGWCELEQVLGDGRRRAVYVNGAAARFIFDEE
jgi:hypothetical protein